MSRCERRWIVSVVHAIYPSGVTGFPLGAKEFPMDHFVEDFFKYTSLQARWGLRFAFLLFQILPFLFIGRLRFFHRLDPKDQQRYLECWHTHRFHVIRGVTVLFKLVASLGFCGFPEVQERIGYDKPNRQPPI